MPFPVVKWGELISSLIFLSYLFHYSELIIIRIFMLFWFCCFLNHHNQELMLSWRKVKTEMKFWGLKGPGYLSFVLIWSWCTISNNRWHILHDFILIFVFFIYLSLVIILSMFFFSHLFKCILFSILLLKFIISSFTFDRNFMRDLLFNYV